MLEAHPHLFALSVKCLSRLATTSMYKSIKTGKAIKFRFEMREL